MPVSEDLHGNRCYILSLDGMFADVESNQACLSGCSGAHTVLTIDRPCWCCKPLEEVLPGCIGLPATADQKSALKAHLIGHSRSIKGLLIRPHLAK